MCVCVCYPLTVQYLLSAGLLQSVHHSLKLQRFDLHLAVQSVEQCFILRVHVIIWLLHI